MIEQIVREPLTVEASEKSIGRLDIELPSMHVDDHDDGLRQLRYERDLWKAVAADLQARLAENA